MVDNNIQFAVVREDSNIESGVVHYVTPSSSLLLIGSGGCTAFNLQATFPNCAITILDSNPAQIDLIHKKTQCLLINNRVTRNATFGIRLDDPNSFTGCGNFESLFRSFRNFIYEFVSSQEDWLKFFMSGGIPSVHTRF